MSLQEISKPLQDSQRIHPISHFILPRGARGSNELHHVVMQLGCISRDAKLSVRTMPESSSEHLNVGVTEAHVA